MNINYRKVWYNYKGEKMKINKNQLKYIALISMILDHIGLFFIPVSSGFFGILLRVFGRLAAPIFCYSLAEGFGYTSSKKKYGIRLSLFAIISQFAYSFAHFNKIFTFEFNVIVTFFISFMMLLAYEKINNKILKWLCVILIITLSLPCDWAIIGPLFVLTFYLNKKSKKEMTIWYSILVSIMIILNSFFLLNNGYHWYGELWQLGLFMFIPVLYMYDGKKIKLNIFNKWIFYVFYPLHFIIIGIIKLLIN
jgi:hypothetical protein